MAEGREMEGSYEDACLMLGHHVVQLGQAKTALVNLAAENAKLKEEAEEREHMMREEVIADESR